MENQIIDQMIVNLDDEIRRIQKKRSLLVALQNGDIDTILSALDAVPFNEGEEPSPPAPRKLGPAPKRKSRAGLKPAGLCTECNGPTTKMSSGAYRKTCGDKCMHAARTRNGRNRAAAMTAAKAAS